MPSCAAGIAWGGRSARWYVATLKFLIGIYLERNFYVNARSFGSMPDGAYAGFPLATASVGLAGNLALCHKANPLVPQHVAHT